MTTPLLLTARAFAGYLQCNTKGQLLARCTIAESPDYTELPLKAFKTVTAGLIETSTSRCFIQYDELAHRFAAQDRRSYLIDYDTTYVEASHPAFSSAWVLAHQGKLRGRPETVMPLAGSRRYLRLRRYGAKEKVVSRGD
jgi:hypothetical protein